MSQTIVFTTVCDHCGLSEATSGALPAGWSIVNVSPDNRTLFLCPAGRAELDPQLRTTPTPDAAKPGG